jgi:Zn-dependent protease with chaperone function
MSLVGSLVLPRAAWVIPVLWLLSGAALFVPPIESAVSRMSFGIRRPTEGELRKLAFPWQAVCQVAGVDSSRYLLLVQDSRAINAFAAGGRTVAVTRTALRLPPQQLEAVLAHELGHHLSGHTVVSMLAWWYALPAHAVTYLIGMAARLVLFVGRIFASFGSALGAAVSLVVALLLLATLVFINFWLILIPFTASLLAWASRLGEFRADRTAALLGYAPALIEVLHSWGARELNAGRPAGLRAKMLATHPPLPTGSSGFTDTFDDAPSMTHLR